MIEVNKLSKLTVGDIAAYERHVKEERKKELIALTKELYGDNIPVDAVEKIERQLKEIPSIFDTGDVDAEAVQYLMYLAAKKTDPDITLKQIGDSMDVSLLETYVEQMMPQPEKLPQTKKKRKRTVKK